MKIDNRKLADILKYIVNDIKLNTHEKEYLKGIIKKYENVPISTSDEKQKIHNNQKK